MWPKVIRQADFSVQYSDPCIAVDQLCAEFAEFLKTDVSPAGTLGKRLYRFLPVLVRDDLLRNVVQIGVLN